MALSQVQQQIKYACKTSWLDASCFLDTNLEVPRAFRQSLLSGFRGVALTFQGY